MTITARGAEALEKAVGQLGGPEVAFAVAGQGRRRGAPGRGGRAHRRDVRRLDVLVNNTGINPVAGPVTSIDRPPSCKISRSTSSPRWPGPSRPARPGWASTRARRWSTSRASRGSGRRRHRRSTARARRPSSTSPGSWRSSSRRGSGSTPWRPPSSRRSSRRCSTRAVRSRWRGLPARRLGVPEDVARRWPSCVGRRRVGHRADTRRRRRVAARRRRRLMWGAACLSGAAADTPAPTAYGRRVGAATAVAGARAREARWHCPSA